MHPDAAAFLWDARRAARRIQEFTRDLTFSEYCSDVLVRSAVERQFEILGQALNRLSRVDPETAASIPDLPRIVAFRNILIHGYASIDNAIVWDIATTRVHGIAALLEALLGPERTSDDPDRSAQ